MKTRSNKIEDIITYINGELKNRYSPNEIKSLTNILFKEYADVSSAHLLACKDDFINESELLNIVIGTERLRKHEPIQYILGKTEFCSLNINVDRSVLIPRPETEEMTRMIIDENRQNNPTVIDLCTGSGCIALALSKFIPQSRVFAVDVSPSALAIAKKNADELGLDVTFLQMDLLTQPKEVTKRPFTFAKRPSARTKRPTADTKRPFISYNGQMAFSDGMTEEINQFDIIVSNPPYVMEKEKAQMQKNVLDYEPSISLFVKDENPLVFYEKINLFARNYLKIGGKMYLEINSALANETLALFSQREYIAELRNDIFNRQRFIFLQKKA